nr:protein FAR-RED IMPAIRED RESPONSE 1-like [Hydra vulgaris]
MIEEHSHFITEESFMHLPHQRHLDRDEKDEINHMLAVKANKKLIQQHMMKSTRKVITLKDVQNINQALRNQDNNNLTTLLSEMLKQKDSVTEVVVNDANQLQALCYQENKMMKLFAHYSELLLLDATYKLYNLCMPLYVLMCVDGNGEGIVVALWIVANEERVTIAELTNIFKKHNNTSGVQVVVTDKDMVEREVISEKIPNASLQICLFHTLRTFRREITVEKMCIKAEQRLLVLEILQQLVYSDSEVTYNMHYDSLKALKLESVIDYFNINWHGIRMQWVEGLKKKKLNLMNSTTNRVENINQKLKSVISKHSGMVTFFSDLIVTIRVLENERRHRAISVFHKSSTSLMSSAQREYATLVTPFAMIYINAQLLAAE